MQDQGGSFDYVVIGAGTAGCLLANRLSRDPARSVLLIEAGGKDSYPWIHIPVGYLYCIGNPRTDWGYSTQAEKGLNGRSLLYPRGRVLGGSSSVNGMVANRGNPRVLREDDRTGRKLNANQRKPESTLELYRFVGGYFSARMR